MTTTGRRRLPEGRIAMSVAEAAATTGLSKDYLHAAIHRGALRAKRTCEGRTGGRFLILAADLDRFLQELPDG